MEPSKDCCGEYTGDLDVTGSCIFCKTFIEAPAEENEDDYSDEEDLT
jgi:hypothetical protein